MIPIALAASFKNQRVGINENGKGISYIINPNSKLSQTLVKTDSQGNQIFYVYGLGLIGQEQSGVYLSYHYDRRGSTTALTDMTSAVTDRFQYPSYGELAKHIGTTSTPFEFNGRDGMITDSNGLYYMRAYYNPDIRRLMIMKHQFGTCTWEELWQIRLILPNPVSTNILPQYFIRF